MSTSFELIEKARAVLSSAGLVVDAVDCSGEMVTCGTTQKPNGTDGRYKIHMDFPPTVWLINYHEGGEGQTFPLYDAGTLDAMTEAEKEALRERIRRERQEAQEKREEERQEAAGKAKSIWAKCAYAKAENAYLSRKGVLPMGDMMQDADGRLVLPVLNSEGETVSLQFIAGDGGKRFLKNGEKKGCFFPIPAKDGGKAGPLLIGEGVATVLSCCMATGFAGLVAFDAGNLLPVAKMAREKYPERVVILCADNDIHEDGAENVGVLKATEAAQAIGARLAVCPAIRGHKADFNDLFTDTEDGPERVRVCIEKARVAEIAASPAMPEEWGMPVPLSGNSLPRLDAGQLPAVLGEFCAGLAEEKQIPVEIAVAMAIATMATAAQGRYMVRIREGYAEPLNLYTICPLEPANRKSATVEACIAPLKEWERRMAEAMAPQVKEAKSLRATLEKAIENKRGKGARATSFEQIKELQEEIRELEEQLPEIPQIPRLLADNTTPEALAALMESMGGRIAIITAEGGIFDILAGMYSKGTPNLDLFLKGHSGDSFRVDRRAACPILLDSPCLTLGISPQPITLAERSASRAFRGRGLDGRFLYFMPESLLGRRKLEPQIMPPVVKARFHDKILTLLPAVWSNETPSPVSLELSRDAYELWLSFAGEVEKGLAPGNEFDGLNDWGGKLAGAVARLAGLFHLMTHDRPEQVKVTAETMGQAVYMGAFLTEHAKAAYALMGTDETIEAAKKVLGWIRREAAERFTVRDCHQGLKNQTIFNHVEAVRGALKELEERGYIRQATGQERKTVGRPTSESYDVNPATLRG